MHEEQLAWEKRWGRVAAAAAFGAIALLIAGTIVQATALSVSSGKNEDLRIMKSIDSEGPSLIASSVLQGLSLFALGLVLWYLFRTTRYRREELPEAAVWVIPLGVGLLALAAVLGALDRIDTANQFFDLPTGEQNQDRAEDMLDDRSGAGVAVGAGGTIALAFALVIVNLNAMRAGVVSRFLGIIGMIVGALYVIPLIGGPLIIEVFWLGALAAVFLNYWPGGRGPAWESGTAVPWPTAADKAAAAGGGERPMGGLGSLLAPRPPRQDEPEPAAEPDEEPEGEPHPVSKKRKRKRRR